NPVIFEAIKKTKPGYKDEYQLTDSIKILIEENYDVFYRQIEGTHIDVGTLEDYGKANEYISKIE
ncbi:MAG: nucleotidyl transferase, partial [Candidatus Thermoplasmatota archaeon]